MGSYPNHSKRMCDALLGIHPGRAGIGHKLAVMPRSAFSMEFKPCSPPLKSVTPSMSPNQKENPSPGPPSPFLVASNEAVKLVQWPHTVGPTQVPQEPVDRRTPTSNRSIQTHCQSGPNRNYPPAIGGVKAGGVLQFGGPRRW